MKKITFLMFFISVFTFAQVANVVVTTTNPANSAASVTNITAGNTFDVTFDYTTDQDIILTTEVEFVTFGGTTSSFAIVGSGQDFNLAAGTSGTLTATLTFPTANPIVGADSGTETTWTFPGGDDNTEATRNTPLSLTTSGAGSNAGMRIKFSTDDAGDTITGSAGDFPFSGVTNIEFRDLDFNDIDGVAIPPPTGGITFTLNAPSAVVPVGTLEYGQPFDIAGFTYTSTEDIPDLTVALELIGFGTQTRSFEIPGTAVLVSDTPLTAGTDQSLPTMTLTLPANDTFTDGDGNVWTIGPGGTSDVTVTPPGGPAETQVNTRIKFTSSNEDNTINGLPNNGGGNFGGTGTNIEFRDILIDNITGTTLSIIDFDFSTVSVYPNPTSDLITISGLNNIEEITIHNTLGQLVKNVKNTNTVDISDLENGIYFLETNNQLKRKVLKN
ncbi:T9SS type A sorting domain-containing protein [uncultured Aquimarina sp.]|uniref:T9SS type A sorting domain-containing protein n=1 Tax=uncultured Aquimarina sp. TaxID=575652 RepID=UPI00260A075F|nr:T9SS type A sorting domain-containing protein [uncultured Aquimarina sp.]